jgi:hypothetical protein
MDHAPLVLCFWIYLSNGFQHTHALVSHNEPYTFQTASPEPLKEADPAFLVFLHALGSAQHFPVSVTS